MKTCRDESTLRKIEERLDIEFRNKDLLLQAFTHRSHLNECRHHPVGLGHNERLEFLGDAVLELVVTEHLFKKFPNEPEGVLTQWRSALVNAQTCARIFRELNLEQFLLMSTGEAKDTNSKARLYILANATEALIGAIYIDQGIGASRLFIDVFFLAQASQIIKECRDYKGELLEMAQAEFHITPVYRVLEESGPDHSRNFLVGCFLHSLEIARAEGTSKKEAEIAAAKVALETKNQWEERVERGADVRGSTMRRSRKGTTNGT